MRDPKACTDVSQKTTLSMAAVYPSDKLAPERHGKIKYYNKQHY
jgi:hypothetical protein